MFTPGGSEFVLQVSGSARSIEIVGFNGFFGSDKTVSSLSLTDIFMLPNWTSHISFLSFFMRVP